MSDTVKHVLDESRILKAWYNIMADLPVPAPAVLHPGTLQPVDPDDFAPLFPMELIQQEVTQERDVEIPESVRDVYRQWRPCPLYRARRPEQALQTPARIYYKYEGVSPAGSHKPNTAVPLQSLLEIQHCGARRGLVRAFVRGAEQCAPAVEAAPNTGKAPPPASKATVAPPR